MTTLLRTMFSSMMHHDTGTSKPPLLLKYRSAKWFVNLAIVPVMPFALKARAGVKQGDVQHWVSVFLAVYGAALLVGSAIFGWIADNTKSRRSPFLFGLLALAGATVMLCLGKSVSVLLIGRMLQGFSAAIVWTVGLALLVDTVGHEHIGQAMGYVFLSLSLAFPLAPIMGGVVYDRSGYYAVYYMSFGLIAFDMLLRVLLIEKKVASRWLDTERPIEPRPADSAVHDPEAIEPISEGQGTKEQAIQEENVTQQSSKWSDRLPPVLTLLKSRRLLSALWCCLVQSAIYAGLESVNVKVLPLFVNRTFGWTSTGGGLVFLADVAPSFLGPLVGWASDTYGPRYFATSGLVLGLPPLVCLRFVTENTIEHKVLLCALLAMIGLSLTLVISPVLAEITYVVEAKEKKHPGIFGSKGAYAQAYGLFNVSFAGGTLVGPLWAGFVEARAGWNTMAWTMGLLCVVSAVPAWLFTGGFVTRPDLSQRQMSRKRKREAAAEASA
ncbi:MAG: hypothetical protein M1816_003538 [Peltula sp. TS41687]|nr:MAG: hypothetical protein M1816_003538 [Peltula sp. TS41687]